MSLSFVIRRHSMLLFIMVVSAWSLVDFGVREVCAQSAPQDNGLKAKTIEIPFTSYDRYDMFGKLTMPTSGGAHAVVIYVQAAKADLGLILYGVLTGNMRENSENHV